MERHKLEEMISAYLDGELDSKQETEFLEEIKKHPDLMTEIEQLKKLDELSSSSKVDFPAEGYFDNLAERIDAQIKREALPEKRSLISKILSPSYRLVTIVGSAAAVVLVAVVALEIYQPAEDVYLNPQPSSEMGKNIPAKIEVKDSIVEVILDSYQIEAVPDMEMQVEVVEAVKPVEEIIKQQAGKVERFGELHIRGGRSNEQIYKVDSIKTPKPIVEAEKQKPPKEKEVKREIEKKKEEAADLSAPVTKDVEIPKDEPQVVTFSKPLLVSPKKVVDSSERVKRDTIDIKGVTATAGEKLKEEKLVDSQVVHRNGNVVEMDEVISDGFSAEHGGFSLLMFIERSEKLYRMALLEKKKEILQSALSRLDSCMRMDSISHRELWQARKDTLTSILDSINTAQK